MRTEAFPVSAARAFAFVTDPEKWPAFFPGFVRIAQAGYARWQMPGDPGLPFGRDGAARQLRVVHSEDAG